MKERRIRLTRKFKYLTQDMKDILDVEIKKYGRETLYHKVKRHLSEQWYVTCMNDNSMDPWKVVGYNSKTGEPVYNWSRYAFDQEYMRKNYALAEINPNKLENFEQEMLYYIDKDAYIRDSFGQTTLDT